MIETPEIIDVAPRTTAVIRLHIPCDECERYFGPAVLELFAELELQGIAPAGPVFDHHFKRPDTHFDFEIGVPTAKPVAPGGRVIPSEWPAFRAAKTVLVGGYEQLSEAWPEFIQWIEGQGLRTATDFWQSFVQGPETDPDPSTWRTELIRALKC
jgi:effector-binding domain-containing protein